MRNILYFIALSGLLVSCASSKNISPQKKKIAKAKNYGVNVAKERKIQPAKLPTKPPVHKENGVEFFSQNIADITKNDNTVSYGSIVTAKPFGYRVTKDYFPAIGQNFRQRYLILHYTALNNERSIEVLTSQGVSAHYLINDINDNEIYQLVDENKRSYHAGISRWGKDTNLNDTSIGIEIVNRGYTADAYGQRWFAEFPDYQIRKVAALAKDIIQRYNIPPTNVLAHSDIAPIRKQDPGPKFPWKKLYDEYQIGMWYDEGTRVDILNQLSYGDFEFQRNTPQFIYQVQSYLRSIGYDVELSGQWDSQTQLVIQAFQYHFRPQLGDGILDKDTYAILVALLKKYFPHQSVAILN
ncbi:N-acetylmuramoyl-L-alanine amidase [Elizabethkingia argentiflava]|uniref:N-acetylmuramoyl-L-alanine amidase n=1 Tax=Elizabethkingia argenteiflava TaxID=2681556 RepID=A0A845PZ39_9FLAO|nr:N-acetylmuramoyl-L-alanine amidase [Elizabethkingia argenteiflava]NAW51628.1 N-acetylmuramoyl-L-alanine amidase [Elizabethkingia argenteiflava]